MSLLDQVIGVLGQQAGGAGSGQTQLTNLAMQLINSHGGLQGLLQQFMNAGLSQQAQSWVSTGQNLPISADQLLQALGGGGKLQELAQQFGMSHADAASGLANLLPQVVDHLTPNGAVQDDVVAQGLDMLRSKLGM
jgi:uncharacterized protein YidB (DUF937 family)